MFILGIVSGILFSSFFVLILYVLVRMLILSKGKTIVHFVEQEAQTIKNASREESDIVFPEMEKEVFLQENSSFNDLINERNNF